MAKIKIGWGEVSLVPEGKKINLAGQFYERITDEVESPITATAMAIECGDDAVIFCSCDLVSVSHILLTEVREQLKDVKGLPVDRIILSATHVHTGPEYAMRHDPLPGVKTTNILLELMPRVKYETLAHYEGDDLLAGEEARFFLRDRIALAIKTAWENRKEGAYAQGFGRAAVGMCRRACYSDGSAKMWGDTDTAAFTELEGGNDSGIEMLFAFDEGKKLTGVVINVACTAQVLEHRNFISSDFFGKAKEFVRRKYGEDVFLLALVSPAGDQCPRDLVRWVEPESPINDPNIVRNDVTVRKADPSMFDLSGCTLAGRRIANEIFFAFESLTEADYIADTVFAHESMMLDMPLRRVTPAETEAAYRAIEAFAEKVGDGTINFKDKAAMHVHSGVIARARAQEVLDVIPIELHFLRLGSVAFATNPYELFLDYGNKIRARSHASQTFLIQHACGIYGYLPTEKAEKGSHYSAYVSGGTAGHEGGDLLVRKTVQAINDLMADN